MALMPPPPLPPVPLVGQAMRVHELVALVTLTCLCRPDNPPMVIRGTDQLTRCGRCGQHYGVVMIEYDRTKGMAGPRVTVAQVTVGPAK